MEVCFKVVRDRAAADELPQSLPDTRGLRDSSVEDNLDRFHLGLTRLLILMRRYTEDRHAITVQGVC